ncbi:ion channel [Acidisphaera rubrifaciens]|uniref:ATP-sensitive potassium transporter n=1 Tax=Acidisphaera rubrifaciens HS-AP3 TaxID=1231350 RepID=A0A0D6P810_9PROT|nr:ion channel [Acidisphaera rubrifaciens]GAN76999.1 ATP-sensitive potassium transporter [Acidisphaera rubrifaciens HS-AP3]
MRKRPLPRPPRQDKRTRRAPQAHAPSRHNVRLDFEGLRAVKLGVEGGGWRDAYSLLFSMRWHVFAAVFVVIYLALNAVFALLYIAQTGAIAGARPGSFLDHFFFSLETLATVGYGEMSPQTLYGHVIAATEIICGVAFTAVLTGLMFSRFSRPKANVVFSAVAVIVPFEGRRSLLLRVASQRSRPMTDVTARLTLLHRPGEDADMRRFYDLELLRDNAPILGLSWTMVHPIDPDGPLADLDALFEADPQVSLIATISGQDETISANVAARRVYRKGDILEGRSFVNIVTTHPRDGLQVDLGRIHETEPLAAKPV